MMLHQAQAASPAHGLPYNLHQLKNNEESSPVDLSRWQEVDPHSDLVYSSPPLPSQETFLDGSNYGAQHFAALGGGFHYPNFAEPVVGSLGSELSGFDAESPYSQPDNGRSTPMSSISYAASGRAGSGRSTTKSSSPGLPSSNNSMRVSKSRPKKAKTSKAVVGKYAPLQIPLSKWGRDNGVDPRNMESIIERSAETRQQEALARKDRKPGRPMNQFMLYRSAYTPIAQRYCEEDGRNHQLVSRVSGDSWKMEPEAIRSYFYKLAKRERDCHMAAFPDYKFAPKNRDRPEDEEELLCNDVDGAYDGGRQFAAPMPHAVPPEPYMPAMYGPHYGMQEGQYDFEHGMAQHGGFEMASLPHHPFVPVSSMPSSGVYGHASSYPGTGPLSPLPRATDQAHFDSLTSMPASDFFNGQGPFPGHMEHAQGHFPGEVADFEPLHSQQQHHHGHHDHFHHGSSPLLQQGLFQHGGGYRNYGETAPFFEEEAKVLMSHDHHHS